MTVDERPDEVQLTRMDAGEFGGYVREAAVVYGEAMRRPPEVVAQRRGLIAGHLDRPGFRAVAALDPGGSLVGFGYAHPGAPGQWWHDVVAGALGRTRADHWLSDCLEIVEFHVHPGWQGRRIGRRMMEMLLEDATQSTVVLSTHDNESAARHLYRSFGFVDLLTGYRFPGGREVFAIMGKRMHP